MICGRLKFGEDWLSSIDPFDEQFRYDLYEYPLWIMHQVAHFVNPRTIVELGVRSGYSAWAILKAVPNARYIGYDKYDPAYAVAYGEGLSEKFHNWALKLIEPYEKAEVIVQDTQDCRFAPPEADLYHIDGCHQHEPELSDLTKCVAAGTDQSVFLVHDFLCDSVRKAVAIVAEVNNLTVCNMYEPRNGIAVLVHGTMPSWVPRAGGGLDGLRGIPAVGGPGAGAVYEYSWKTG